MFDLFLTAPYVPFTIALALLFGLLVLELAFAMIGGTLLGAGGEGLDGPDLDVDLSDVGDLDLDLDFDGLDVDVAELEVPAFEEIALDAPEGAASTGGPVSWLGFGKMPALIWLATMLFSFGAAGFVIQSLIVNTTGYTLPALAAAAPAGAFAIWFTRGFGAVFARLLPKTETAALSERHLGRRQGTVTQGTAARGRPAEVKVTDRYGNTHYLRAEPLRDDAQIPQGAEVIVLRHKYDGGYLLVPLTP